MSGARGSSRSVIARRNVRASALGRGCWQLMQGALIQLNVSGHTGRIWLGTVERCAMRAQGGEFILTPRVTN